MTVLQGALRVQGTYYVVTGVLPLVSMPLFEHITGPKVDDWLVHMVGLLAASIGIVLLAGARSAPAFETMLLAVLSAIAFAAIDFFYGLGGRISPVYLADGILELAFAVIVAMSSRVRSRTGTG